MINKTALKSLGNYSLLIVFTLFALGCSKEDQAVSCDELRMFPDSTQFTGHMSFTCLNDTSKIFTVKGTSYIHMLPKDSVSVHFNGSVDGIEYEKNFLVAAVCDTLPGPQPYLRIPESGTVASGTITEDILVLYYNESDCDSAVRIWGSR